MYIKRIIDINMGPISKIDITPSFDFQGNPKPLVLVGQNGSGKTSMISNIVDCFYELAGEAYGDALHPHSYGYGHEYYKVLSGLQIKNGAKFLFSGIRFDNDIVYFFKSGACTREKLKEESGFEDNIPSWDNNKSIKGVMGVNPEKAEQLFTSNVILNFTPERYEKPIWMGQSYYDDLGTHVFVEPKFNGHLHNQITPTNEGKDNLRWLLDVIVDSRTDVENREGELCSTHVALGNLMLMVQARTNIEMVMSNIIGEEVYFGLDLRQTGGRRFNIRRKDDNSIVAPSMDSLSTGQMALFNIFSTIIRYADNNDINKSIHPSEIHGIVVIDEVELHLHPYHQKVVFPALMNLFPGIQFVVTTHSPLFLLGLEETYGVDGFDIYQMPDGNRIDVESYSEFKNAYSYFENTRIHHEKLQLAIQKVATDKPLIITEGATDWKHMKAAFETLSKKKEYQSVFSGLSFDFFEYEPTNSKKVVENKIDMGKDALVAMCRSFSKLPQNRKLIFIADCDDKKTNDILGCVDEQYKSWGNNVYSFILPVPETRKNTPNISIEHLYSDEEIKTECVEDGISRRLYMGYEFDEKGISKTLGKMCENRRLCGPGKITILEGSSGERIQDIFSEGDKYFALSKMRFSECVLGKKEGFDSFDFVNFLPIFKIIKTIIQSDKTDDPMQNAEV